MEEKWEEFPVIIKTSRFDTAPPIIVISFDDSQWFSGIPRFVTLNPPGQPLPTLDSDWIVLPRDILGKDYLFIPKRPGILRIPSFQITHQTCQTHPSYVTIIRHDFPPYIAL
jgi:hypothetical protein